MKLGPMFAFVVGLLAQLAQVPAVSRGSQSAESLAPAADPSTVTPFVREWGVILPAAEGFKIARPCSRRAPARIEDVWLPDRTIVDRIDRVLPPVLKVRLSAVCRSES